MNKSTLAACQASYDRVAEEYARRIYDELRHKPLDRQLLDQLVQRVGNLGPICDLGCGPGHVARYLYEQGVEALGVDLSSGMVEVARRLNAGLAFRQGDMRALELPDAIWGGIAAFYSLIHIPHEDLPHVLAELRRVLKPGGWLLIAFHIGEQMVHLDEWWGEEVYLDGYFFQPDEMSGYLAQAGFVDIEVFVRDPYPDVEHQSRRAYIFAVPKWSNRSIVFDRPILPALRGLPRPTSVLLCPQCGKPQVTNYPHCAGCYPALERYWRADWQALLLQEQIQSETAAEALLAQIVLGEVEQHPWTCVD